MSSICSEWKLKSNYIRLLQMQTIQNFDEKKYSMFVDHHKLENQEIMENNLISIGFYLLCVKCKTVILILVHSQGKCIYA